MPSFNKTMSSLAFVLATSTSLASAAVAKPLAEANSVGKRGSASNIFKSGSVNDSPPECQFESDVTSFYRLSLEDGAACIGYPDTCNESEGWDEDSRNEIIGALNDLVAKDGQWESAELGDWSATFFLGTTAFADRDHVAFDDALNALDTRSTTYYWSKQQSDGKWDMATISKGGFVPSC